MEKIAKVNTVIFDFDGTLADTFPLVYHTFKSLYKKYKGKNVYTDEIISTFGPTEPAIIEKHFSEHDIDEVKETYFKIYTDKHPELVKPRQEIKDLLDYLKGKGVKLGIMTGKSSRSLDISLQLMGLDGYFDVLVSGDDTKKPKPDPEGLLIALDKLASKPDETLFIGDSNVDVDAGKSADIPTIGIKWFDGPDKGFESTPIAFFSEVNDLKDYLENHI